MPQSANGIRVCVCVCVCVCACAYMRSVAKLYLTLYDLMDHAPLSNLPSENNLKVERAGV